MISRPVAFLLPILLLGCTGKEPQADSSLPMKTDTIHLVIDSAALDSTGEVSFVPEKVVDPNIVPADTLVLTMRDGTQVWLTAGRVAKGEDGVACRERGVELRKGGTRRAVPLLFVTNPPRQRKGVLSALLSSNCKAVDGYTIDPVTAQPRKR